MYVHVYLYTKNGVHPVNTHVTYILAGMGYDTMDITFLAWSLDWKSKCIQFPSDDICTYTQDVYTVGPAIIPSVYPLFMILSGIFHYPGPYIYAV